ncbi:MAG: hypothetical protein EXR98_09630 [Gemmataceae bacterium]|nr:hypothetical protein [Gemmataceae bacterium]
MKRWLGPRVWIALMAGIAAGLLAWMLPPLPSGRFMVSVPRPTEERQPFVQVLGLSSDGRYVITRQGMAEPPPFMFDVTDVSIAVWDRQRGSQLPVITHEKLAVHGMPLLSPDAATYAFITSIPDEPAPDGRTTNTFTSSIKLYELPSGRELKEFKSSAVAIWFSRDSKLLAYEKGAVHEVKTGRQVSQVPSQIEGYKFQQIKGDHAVYHDDKVRPAEVRVYDWRTGELRASATLPISEYVTQISDDGHVLCWLEWSWLTLGGGPPTKILDASTGVQRDLHSRPGYKLYERVFAVASPDGEILAFRDDVAPLHKWLRWLPIQQTGKRLRITRWKTNEELVAWPTVKEVCFSADGKHLAAVREDHVIEFYEFPFRKPWGLIAGVAVAVAASSWSVGWWWSRRRSRKSEGAI